MCASRRSSWSRARASGDSASTRRWTSADNGPNFFSISAGPPALALLDAGLDAVFDAAFVGGLHEGFDLAKRIGLAAFVSGLHEGLDLAICLGLQ